MRPASVPWHGLLVSVRDAAEAVEAVAGGAAIVDVKEPACGPLGAAAAETAAAIAGVIAGRVPWTVACGELAAGGARAAAHVAGAIASLPRGTPWPAAAKAGPAGLMPEDWRREFAAFVEALPRGVEPVAVAYADWRAADAPPPEAIIARAVALGARTLLIDTFDKQAAGILGPATRGGLPAWIVAAHAAGLAVAVAGRLNLAEVARAADLGADVVAVRSAVCRGGRMGRVDRSLVARVADFGQAPAADGRRAATLPPSFSGPFPPPLVPRP
ncbi:MAG: (5-formylfuran-3-yl)methyl phosphate synthase [Planctomycetaceae bacterium]